MGGVVHDQERCALFDAEFQYADDMRAGELRDGARLGEELVERTVGQANLEDFDSCRCLEIDMPGQVDLGEAPPGRGARATRNYPVAVLYSQPSQNASLWCLSCIIKPYASIPRLLFSFLHGASLLSQALSILP